MTMAAYQSHAAKLMLLLLWLPSLIHAQDLILRNPFGTAYGIQPVVVPLSNAESPDKVLVDDDGRMVGQVSRDGKSAFLRVGFSEGEKVRSIAFADRTSAQLPSNPVVVRRKTWTANDAEAAGTVRPNGVRDYFEITNGLCGVRVAASVAPGALPAIRVPTPVVGVMYPGGDWAGRPDFRSLVVPHTSAGNGDVITRVSWRFESFSGEIIEEGPIRTIARVTIGGGNRANPYVYEITIHADEKFVKITQLDGKPNDWFLDLTLDHRTNWRPSRWRSGANHHWFGDGAGPERGVILPKRTGKSYNLKWESGPGPANDRKPQKEFYGEGEGDLWSHDAWVEFTQDAWGYGILGHRHGYADLQTHHLKIRGQAPWFPWGGVGEVLYAFDHAGGQDSPVAGLLTAPAGEISGWNAGDNPHGIVNFSQHLPSWLEANPYNNIAYLENWRYDGVVDRSRPIFGVKFMMPMRSGSVYLWLGRNEDIITNISDSRITEGYRSKPWLDWARFTNGIATLEDALEYTSEWRDPEGNGGIQYIEDDVVERTISRVRAGQNLGNWEFLKFWRQTNAGAQLSGLETFLGQKETDVRSRIDQARFHHWGLDHALQWYTFERSVGETLDTLALYFSLGKAGSGGIVPEAQWQRLKNLAAFYFHHTFDEDRALLWNTGVTINHGGGTMLSPAIAARMGIIQAFPTWPDSERFRERPVGSAQSTLLSQIGRLGAQFTSTHYSSLAAITGPLADLQALQFLSYTDPHTFPDEYARDPRLRHHAHFVLNRMGVKDPRNGNRRMPIAVGNAGPGWGAPASAILASGFRHIDPQLAGHLMWAWRENGMPNSVTPPLPKMVDYDMPSQPYPFPAISTFPGNMTIHRSAPHTIHETGVWITDGSFFSQHREQAESGEVHIDALGKPLVTNSYSYASPRQTHPFYKNVISPLISGWDADSQYVGTAVDPWSMHSDRVVAIGSFGSGSYSRSEFGGGSNSWRREVALIRPDVDHPVIVVRDTLAESKDYMSSFWLQTAGAIEVPGGAINPPIRICPGTNDIVPTAAQSPSAVRIPGPLSAGVNTFRFRGHNWQTLYPLTYAKPNAPDVGQSVDVDVHVINENPVEAVVGHWRTRDPANRFAWDDGGIDDRQLLRVRFSGRVHTTIFTPYLRGMRPGDLSVTTSGSTVSVRYTNSAGIGRVVTINHDGYRVETNGVQTIAESFPVSLPERLYPGWSDLPHAGAIHPLGSDHPRVQVSDAPAWANGVYEQIPHGAITGMLTDRNGVRDPLSSIANGGQLDSGRPCYRIVSGDRMAYVFAIRNRGYYIARLPVSGNAQWIQEKPVTASSTNPTGVTKWATGGLIGTEEPLDSLRVTVRAPYAITYDSNGATSGTAPASQAKIQDSPIQLRSNYGNLQRSGFVFDGWSTVADGSGLNFRAGDQYVTNAPLALYARWKSHATNNHPILTRTATSSAPVIPLP